VIAISAGGGGIEGGHTAFLLEATNSPHTNSPDNQNSNPQAGGGRDTGGGGGRVEELLVCGHGRWGQLGNKAYTHISGPVRVATLAKLREWDEAAKQVRRKQFWGWGRGGTGENSLPPPITFRRFTPLCCHPSPPPYIHPLASCPPSASPHPTLHLHSPPHPPQVVPLRITSLSCGDRHTAAVLSSGNVFTWGWNEAGQLGTGALQGSHTPAMIKVRRGNALQPPVATSHRLPGTAQLARPAAAPCSSPFRPRRESFRKRRRLYGGETLPPFLSRFPLSSQSLAPPCIAGPGGAPAVPRQPRRLRTKLHLRVVGLRLSEQEGAGICGQAKLRWRVGGGEASDGQAAERQAASLHLRKSLRMSDLLHPRWHSPSSPPSLPSERDACASLAATNAV
jgi:hypothetical protein